MPKVTILQYRLFHYRMDLFNHLKRLADERGIDLHLVVGQPFGAEKLKKDEGVLPWAEKVKNTYFPIKEKKDLCWQPLPSALKDSDLIVFMQENRLLSNYWWMLKRRLGGPLVAFWGHGRDYQSRAPGGFRERWKQWSINQVDWWFAYTSMTCQHIAEAGFPAERTTCLNNAIDVSGLRRDWAGVSDETKAQIRLECKIDNDSVVGLFCGSLYPDKKLDLLVEACDLIHTRLPNFRLVVIGDGSSRSELEQAFVSRPWATWVGVKRGVDKAAYFGVASIVLNPGLVGLHILDAFAMGAPMLTTSTALHSPEIAYLEDGVNGVMTDDSPQAYADAALAILSDRDRLAAMSKAANETAEKYTVENMASNFMDGIEQALKLKGRV
jgi:glycosyltransferase involved in cell wall biosynthesis